MYKPRILSLVLAKIFGMFSFLLKILLLGKFSRLLTLEEQSVAMS